MSRYRLMIPTIALGALLTACTGGEVLGTVRRPQPRPRRRSSQGTP